jgi:hypothetical protein
LELRCEWHYPWAFTCNTSVFGHLTAPCRSTPQNHKFAQERGCQPRCHRFVLFAVAALSCGGENQKCCPPADGGDCKCNKPWVFHTFLMPDDSKTDRTCGAPCGGSGQVACTGEALEVAGANNSFLHRARHCTKANCRSRHMRNTSNLSPVYLFASDYAHMHALLIRTAAIQLIDLLQCLIS